MSIYDGRETKGVHNHFHDEDTLWDKIKYKYWEIIPYDWRPSQILYQLKCRLWYKYTTYKPRYLDHTWCDRDVVLLHMNFEILSMFIEKECSPGHVDWEHDEPHRQAMAEMRDLYNWWIDCHTDRPKDHYGLLDKQYDELYQVYSHLLDEADGPTEHIPLRDKDGKIYAYKWQTEYEDEEKHYEYVMARAYLEKMHNDFLEQQLIRLIRCRRWFWT